MKNSRNSLVQRGRALLRMRVDPPKVIPLKVAVVAAPAPEAAFWQRRMPKGSVTVMTWVLEATLRIDWG